MRIDMRQWDARKGANILSDTQSDKLTEDLDDNANEQLWATIDPDGKAFLPPDYDSVKDRAGNPCYTPDEPALQMLAARKDRHNAALRDLLRTSPEFTTRQAGLSNEEADGVPYEVSGDELVQARADGLRLIREARAVVRRVLFYGLLLALGAAGAWALVGGR